MAEWFKAAVLKTVERKFRGFESYSLRQKTVQSSMLDVPQYRTALNVEYCMDFTERWPSRPKALAC